MDHDQMAQGTLAPPSRFGLSELIDQSIRLYRQNFALFFGIMVVPFVPAALIPALARGVAGAADRSIGLAVVLGLLVLIVGAVMLVLSVMSVPAMFWAITERRAGRPATVGWSYRVGRDFFWRSLGLGTLIFIPIALLFVTVIGIPVAVYLSVAWGFAYQSLVLEGTGVWRALGRSRELVRGRWWRTFGYALVWTIAIAIIGSIVSVPVAVVVGIAGALSPAAAPVLEVLAGIVNVLVQGLTAPLTYCAWMLYYFDLRARQDGVVDPLPPAAQPAA